MERAYNFKLNSFYKKKNCFNLGKIRLLVKRLHFFLNTYLPVELIKTFILTCRLNRPICLGNARANAITKRKQADRRKTCWLGIDMKREHKHLIMDHRVAYLYLCYLYTLFMVTACMTRVYCLCCDTVKEYLIYL